MKELEENTIEQIRTLLNYLEQTDLLNKKDILRWNLVLLVKGFLCKSHFLQK